MNAVNHHLNHSLTPENRIVITGMGVLCPCGQDIETYSSNLRAGNTGIQQHDHLFADKAVWAGLVNDFDPSLHFTADEQQKMDRTAQMGYIAAKQAVDDAGLAIADACERAALLLGTSHGGRSQLDDFVISGGSLDTPDNPRKLLVTAAHFNQTAAVANKLGLHGPTATLSNACSSSGAAIAYAVELLRSGKCDHAIAGGADGFSRLTFSGFSALGAMADGPCAPFSEPVGLSLGDGAAFIVLETLASAQKRGAKIYAEIWGYGLSWDAYHITAPEPSGDGMNRAMQMALTLSGIDRDQIEYINVHGTGTRSNDLAETVGLQRFFGKAVPPISATKSQTGHMLGASSVIGLISCVLGMRESWLPPTSNFTEPRSGCELDVVPNRGRDKQWNCFAAQSAAFAGANAVLVGGPLRENRFAIPFADDDEIVISGVGLVSPLGCDTQEFWNAVAANQSGIVDINEFDVSDCGCHQAGMVRDFQARKLMPTINLRRVDRVAAFATIATYLAMKHAGRWPLQDRSPSTGLVVGVCRGAALSYEKYLASVAGECWDKASAVYFPNLVMSSVGGQVSASLGLRGVTSSLVGSNAAGLQAMVHGWELLKRNPAQESVIVVASDEISPLYYHLFDRLGKLASSDSSSPFAPYQAGSNGTVLGEGSVALVLERKSKVRERGGKILARLTGSGVSHDDVNSPTAGSSTNWAAHAMRAALADAKLTTDQIQRIQGNGTGIASEEERELAAAKELFGAAAKPMTVNHLTGIAEASSSLFNVAAVLTELSNPSSSTQRALVTATGHDGANVAVVLESENAE